MKPVIFLDSGGVINDKAARAPQWRRLVAEYFAPRLGGTKAAWADANRQTVERLFDPESLQERFERAGGWISFQREYDRDWISMMCEIVGVEVPDEEHAVAMAADASRQIVRTVQAPMPGAAGAIRRLHTAGFTLYTASGEYSFDLDSILMSLDVRECFERLYGPDLVDTFKRSPEYYRRVFADAGVRPPDALVVDDNPGALEWAIQAGAQAILVHKEPPPDWAAARIRSLSELPRWLEGG